MSFESSTAAEQSSELRKEKDKLSELEIKTSKLEKENNALNLKVKDMESTSSRRGYGSSSSRDNPEVTAKLKFSENKVNQLENENDKLLDNVQNLEGELEEVQDITLGKMKLMNIVLSNET